MNAGERRDGSAVQGADYDSRPRADFPGLVGVLVDPTTAGIGDSERAMGYAEPWDDSLYN